MTSPSKTLRAVTLVLRIALGVVFVYAAWTKLRMPWELFAMSIDSYQVLPLKVVELVARTLPWFELAVGLLLIAGYWLRGAAAATALLLAVFFGLMVRAYAKGMEINCGCFGTGDPISWKTLLRDGSMLAAALALTVLSFLGRRKPEPDGAAGA
ncbi:MAG: MauE/DoxX family redox-associated membrane protein [Bryobacteraceae bacterium]